jgi:hypothetical protein
MSLMTMSTRINHSYCSILLWRVDPLLSGDSVKTTVSGQRLGKHVPAATNTHATIELLLETGCFLCGPCRDLISKRQSQLLGGSARESVKVGPERVKLKNLHVRNRC